MSQWSYILKYQGILYIYFLLPLHPRGSYLDIFIYFTVQNVNFLEILDTLVYLILKFRFIPSTVI